jgi:hypothetical protein
MMIIMRIAPVKPFRAKKLKQWAECVPVSILEKGSLPDFQPMPAFSAQ